MQSSMVVKTATKREEVKASAAKDMSNKMQDSSSLIKVLESHFDEYMKVSAARVEQTIQQHLNTLKSHDWDLYKMFPRRAPYNKYNEQIKNFYSWITKEDGRTTLDTNPRQPNPSGIAKWHAQQAESAKAAYEDFVHKMITKIGKPVIDAKLTGSIWTDATLTVTTNDGESQVWHTKIIVNTSKYGTMFNQFPSRRKK